MTAGSAFALARICRRADAPDASNLLPAKIQTETTTGQKKYSRTRFRYSSTGRKTRLLRAPPWKFKIRCEPWSKLPFARSVTGRETPSIVGVAQAFFTAAKFRGPVQLFHISKGISKRRASKTLRNYGTFPVALKMVLLEEILARAAGCVRQSSGKRCGPQCLSSIAFMRSASRVGQHSGTARSV